MKKKSSCNSAFFNLRVLILIALFTGGVVVALFATSATGRAHRGEANPSRLGFGHATAESVEINGSSAAPALTINPMPPSGGVQEAWVARYNGPGNFYDYANSIAVDSSGNVYVTGASVGSAVDDYATVKYDSSGQEQWVARYNGPGNGSDGAYAIAVDSSGNVYVTGASTGSGFDGDYATVKYDSSGQEQWVARYNGPGNGEDYAFGIAVDASGNVYVTGWSQGPGTIWGYATVKYDSSGQEQWVARYNGPGGDDGAGPIAVDSSGNVYVTGASLGSGTGYDYATIKYDSSGQEQWVARYNGPGNDYDAASSIAVDSSGNVHVTGASTGSGTDNDYATIKYDSSGQEQWIARYNGPGNGSDGAYAIAVDSSGNVYVTGWSTGSGTDNDYATIKYDSSGQEQWIARYNGPGNGWDGAYAIAVDSSGNVYVTGYGLGSGTGNDYATIKYSQSTPTPTPTPTVTPTATATPTSTATSTPTPSVTPTSTPTPTPTASATPSVTPTASPTATATPTPTSTPRSTPTPRPRPAPRPRPTPPQ